MEESPTGRKCDRSALKVLSIDALISSFATLKGALIGGKICKEVSH
jgi:hypothetical protein